MGKLMPSRPIRLTSSTLRSTTLTSKPELPRKFKLPTMPGRPDTVPKRDSQLTPLVRPGPPTCQTTLLMSQTSTKDHQPHSPRLWLMPRKPKLLLKVLPKPQLLSSNSPEETRSSPKREPLNPPSLLNLNPQPPLPVPAHQDQARATEMKKTIEYQLQKLLRFLIENLYLRNLSKIYFHNITV